MPDHHAVVQVVEQAQALAPGVPVVDQAGLRAAPAGDQAVPVVVPEPISLAAPLDL